MQISSVQTQAYNARFTLDRVDAASVSRDTIQDRSRQEQVRQVAQAVRSVNESSQLPTNRELSIVLDRDSGQPVVRLIDRQTREVIRQIPDERVLRMAEEFKRVSAQRSTSGETDWQSTQG